MTGRPQLGATGGHRVGPTPESRERKARQSYSYLAMGRSVAFTTGVKVVSTTGVKRAYGDWVQLALAIELDRLVFGTELDQPPVDWVHLLNWLVVPLEKS